MMTVTVDDSVFFAKLGITIFRIRHLFLQCYLYLTLQMTISVIRRGFFAANKSGLWLKIVGERCLGFVVTIVFVAIIFISSFFNIVRIFEKIILLI